MTDSIFHSGELQVQQISGEDYFAARNSSLIADQIRPGVANFVNTQSYFFAASQDENGAVWASILAGAAGFMNAKDPTRLDMDPQLLKSDPEDVFWRNITCNASVGLLFIDLNTRKRFRINGHVTFHAGIWTMEIAQAYPNCPKYIQKRDFSEHKVSSVPVGNNLKNWIETLDTLFVASSSVDGNLDLSHRGGNKGFVKWIAEDILRIPDYRGNSMFNTLGNFYDNPLAGLLFIDFSNGDTVQLTGSAIVHLNEEGFESFTGGTNRFWDFKVEKIIYKKSLPDFRMDLIDYSPYNP